MGKEVLRYSEAFKLQVVGELESGRLAIMDEEARQGKMDAEVLVSFKTMAAKLELADRS